MADPGVTVPHQFRRCHLPDQPAVDAELRGIEIAWAEQGHYDAARLHLL
jgi:hypothetical protein